MRNCLKVVGFDIKLIKQALRRYPDLSDQIDFLEDLKAKAKVVDKDFLYSGRGIMTVFM